MTNLEQEILQLINETICGIYEGKLAVIVSDGWYELRLYLDQEQSPMAWGFEGTEEEFKAFIVKELRSRSMERVSFWKALQELPSWHYTVDCDWEFDYEDALIT